jgi:hypothetical protein
VKHAGPAALDRLEPMLAELRELEGLKEKARGVFYRRGRACLHFHEDAAGLHADLRLAGDDFDRFRIEDDAERAALLDRVRAGLA